MLLIECKLSSQKRKSLNIYCRTIDFTLKRNEPNLIYKSLYNCKLHIPHMTAQTQAISVFTFTKINFEKSISTSLLIKKTFQNCILPVSAENYEIDKMRLYQ